ncbi:GTP-binding protein Di-Ras2 [Schistosoma japonicum]|nr:GTP-binding protein Di-Ras2 [Schistosoma japonicum]
MQRLSITKAHAFILVYSITNKASFEELQPLYTELTLIKMDELSKVPIMLVGNKIDENDNREVSQAHGRALAQKWKCGFMETSAKSNFNVKEVFQELLKMETRRNMTLVGDIKTRSRFTSFFKRRPNELQSTNTIGIVNSSTTTTTSLIDALDMPKHINTIQEQPIATTSKDKKIPLKLKKFLSIKTNSDTTDTVKNDINGDFPQT